MTDIKEIKRKITAELENVRPFLQNDGGDIKLVEITDDFVVIVELLGACGTCPTSVITLKMGVENYLKQKIPEVKEVVNKTELNY